MNRENIKKEIFNKFPEFLGIEPTVRIIKSDLNVTLKKKLGISSTKSIPENYSIFTFRKTITASNGFVFEKIVRATVSVKGKIIKITQSR